MNTVFPAQALLAGRAVAAGLGLVAGFVDAFGYLRWHAFGANMTGNTVLFAVSLHGNAMSALMPLSLIVIFVTGSVLGRAVMDRLSPAAGLCGEAVLLIAAAFAPGSAALGLMSGAMGVQNASLSAFAGVSANTAFLTGDYSKFGQALADFIVRGRSEESRRTVSILAPLIAAYAGGALLAAFFSRAFYVELLVVPIVLAIAYATYRGALT